MKQKLPIIIPILLLTITIIIIIFASNSTKTKEEYKLIELTGNELTNTILSKKDISITFALYNDYDIQAQDFLEDLKTTTKQAGENIYYVNTSHASFEFSTIMESLISKPINILSYYVYQNGELVVANNYNNFKSMYKELNGKKYNTKIIETSKKEKEEAIKKANKLYEEGDISGAHNELSIAWNTKEAKNTYSQKPLYMLIGSWEIYEPDEELINTKYINFVFTNYYSSLFIAEDEGKIDGFKKPSYNKYEKYDINIKDNYIYTKKENETKYKKGYKIESISKYNLTLSNEKKVYKFQYGN